MITINTASKAQQTNLYYARSYVQLLPPQYCTAPSVTTSVPLSSPLLNPHIAPRCRRRRHRRRLLHDPILPHSLIISAVSRIFKPFHLFSRLVNSCCLYPQKWQGFLFFNPLTSVPYFFLTVPLRLSRPVEYKKLATRVNASCWKASHCSLSWLTVFCFVALRFCDIGNSRHRSGATVSRLCKVTM